MNCICKYGTSYYTGMCIFLVEINQTYNLSTHSVYVKFVGYNIKDSHHHHHHYHVCNCSLVNIASCKICMYAYDLSYYKIRHS
jgi:hypothetical protein